MVAPAHFIVLTGFLGSGKTTLLSDFLNEDNKSQTAVIVNDIGKVNIDGAIIATRSGVPMATLSNGCVCCSLTNDLQYTIEAMIEERRLSGAPPFTRMILECSGISYPGAVLRSLSELSRLNMCVSVVTTYACDRGLVDSNDFELAATQLAAAHIIVLTRLDLANAEAIEQAAATAQALGPMAKLIVEPERSARAALALGTASLSRGAGQSNGCNVEPGMTLIGHPRLNVFALHCDEKMDWPALSAWLENLAGYLDERLLRVKGLMSVFGCDEQILIQGVGQHFDTPRRIATGYTSSRLIIIARDTKIEELQAITPNLPFLHVSVLNDPGTTNKDETFKRPTQRRAK